MASPLAKRGSIAVYQANSRSPTQPMVEKRANPCFSWHLMAASLVLGHNGVVDAADYIVWRDTLTQTAAPAGSGGDDNANGTIDAGDYDYWRARFGNIIAASGSGAGKLTTVPEPAAAALLLTGLIAFAWRLK